MSLRTTLARAEARAARAAWDFHRHNCPPCSRWVIQPRGGNRGCDTGIRLRTHAQATERQLKREREADRQPAPGQEGLW